MTAVRIISWIARIVGAAALLLGLFYWITGIDIVIYHMLCGLTLALSFLILSIIMVFTGGLRLLGIIGILYALILPVFGATQGEILPGDLHWLIRAAHMLVGIGALALIQSITTRYQRLKSADRAGNDAILQTQTTR